MTLTEKFNDECIRENGKSSRIEEAWGKQVNTLAQQMYEEAFLHSSFFLAFAGDNIQQKRIGLKSFSVG